MINGKYEWAPIIPLIGGFPLGAYAATGRKPNAIYSYTPFQNNDSHLVNYWNDVDYVMMDDGRERAKWEPDIMVATPPCAALSQLNTGKTEQVKGVCAASTQWMFQSAEDSFKWFRPQVFIGENAPALYTNKGKAVADQLYELAKKHGYSFSLYKTNTRFHGVPQSRERTFYFFWDSPKVPILNFYDRPRKNFLEYLNELDENDLQNDIVINKTLMNEPKWRFLKDRYNTDDPRNIVLQRANTTHSFLMKNDIFSDYVEWIEKNGSENEIRLAHHARDKFAKGLGIWDGSTHVFGDVMNAVIGRNLNDTVHPTKDRSLTIREALYMMGFPRDFELLGGRAKLNHIAQNVPVCTARDMVSEAMAVLNGEREFYNGDFLRQNNVKKETENMAPRMTVTLEAFFEV